MDDHTYSGTTTAETPIDLEAMSEEVQRLRKMFGKPPIRLECGIAVWVTMQRDLQRPPSSGDEMSLPQLPIWEWNGIRVHISSTLAPDEWSLVYRG